MRFQKYQSFRNKMRFNSRSARPFSRLRNWLGGLAMLCFILAIAVLLEKSRFGQVAHMGLAEAIDGDSLRMNGVEMRLKGLDAPEYSQSCTGSDGREIACGRLARRALAEALRAGHITCTETAKDRYGRALVTCAQASEDIGARLVLQGNAIAYGGYEREEAQAKLAKRGLWAGSFERPADWRKRNPREVAPK